MVGGMQVFYSNFTLGLLCRPAKIRIVARIQPALPMLEQKESIKGEILVTDWATKSCPITRLSSLTLVGFRFPAPPKNLHHVSMGVQNSLGSRK